MTDTKFIAYGNFQHDGHKGVVTMPNIFFKTHNYGSS